MKSFILHLDVQVGDLPTAERVFQQLDEWQLQPDVTWGASGESASYVFTA